MEPNKIKSNKFKWTKQNKINQTKQKLNETEQDESSFFFVLSNHKQEAQIVAFNPIIHALTNQGRCTN
jgi:polyphosphate kinase 2 (PPK2 family)